MPLRTFNASVGKTCKLCDAVFKEGEKSVLLALMPTDPEEVLKMRAGRPYNTEGVEVHLFHVEELNIER